MKKKTLFFLIISVLIFTSGLIAQEHHASNLSLLPWPKKVIPGNGQHILTENFSLRISGNFDKRIYRAATSFLNRLDQRTGLLLTNKDISSQTNKTSEGQKMEIRIERPGKTVLFEDESYSLQVKNEKIILSSVTDLGAMHGLESLLQLLQSDEQHYFFPQLTIEDSPRFAWRGLMIDVARHYLPLSVLKRNIDAMATVKLNVFHWHLSDDQGFRVEIKSYPELHKKASDGLFYTQDEIREIVRYASDRGIRVVPEIDVPGHATAILTAYPELASKDTTYTLERNKGIFHATLDPTKEATYTFMESVISELAVLFPDAYFHIGGDENEGKHWDESSRIRKFKKEHQIKDNHQLQTYFNIRLQKILKANQKRMMGWDEILEPGLPKDIVIHSWRGKEAMIKAAKQGYKSVLSKGYYIDLLFDTKTHYENDPISDSDGLNPEEVKNILGGEATMWGELVDANNVDSRIWPRTAAIAERFWSASSVNDFDFLVKRLNAISVQLEASGLDHIKSRDRILRGLFHTNDIEAFRTLSEICRPITARERVGKPYKTYYPLTLFVDACTPDNPLTMHFNKLVRVYLTKQDQDIESEIKSYLLNWKKNHDRLLQKHRSPTLTALLPLSEAIAELSGLLLQKIETKKKFDKVEQERINVLLDRLDTPVLNVRSAITADLKLLSENINTP
ncbi:family 20 glycosylhydrolase [Leptobacterium flavescens]|uniref:Family 20 glycosylhydrolase n=1 Tax=Leptobacterium flavescens TaxID=472055 RepID=A0A6P0UQZ3_9FLAO|nr:family 20 glycosylhydrolase [Leptobacterium flavescens]NER12836.1 family 20 glycosylhydrolase [Leptobacterium flavescens]